MSQDKIYFNDNFGDTVDAVVENHNDGQVLSVGFHCKGESPRFMEFDKSHIDNFKRILAELEGLE